jgi:hypothetical protein
MKRQAIRTVILLVAVLGGSAANAANYDYTAHWTYIRKPAVSDAQLQADASACTAMIGDQLGTPTPDYRSCMLGRGWKFSSVTRVKAPAAPADPYFSSTATVKPGHFIDHDSGLDCQNMGGASVCDPPNGTVHYFDPDQGLPCTRTGLVSVCSNM